MNFMKLKGIMCEKGYSQEKLASEIGINTATMNKKLNNKAEFTVEEMVKIMIILDIENPNGIFFTLKVA